MSYNTTIGIHAHIYEKTVITGDLLSPGTATLDIDNITLFFKDTKKIDEAIKALQRAKRKFNKGKATTPF